MELELGLKITHNRDDLTSKMTDFKITKDPSGPLFLSKETESKFVLFGHLKGFRRENIEIGINETGNRISVSGKKPVQEMVLMGWIMCRKEVEVRAFRKVFRIPERVKLDKIKAKLNDETSTLTIVMPKSEKGVFGVEIEEMKEEEEDKGRIEAEKAPGIEKAEEEVQKDSKEPIEKEESDQLVEREVPETIHQKNEGLEDSDKVSEKVGGEAVREKPEASEERISSKEQRVDRDEPRTLPNEAEKAPERVEEQVEEEPKEPTVKCPEESDQVMEISHAGPETEPQASTGKAEAAEKESDHSQKTEQQPTEETQIENHPEERAQVQEIDELVRSLEDTEYKSPGDDQVTAPMEPLNSKSNEIEEEETTQEKYQLENEKPRESPRREPGEQVQESTKPGPHQETEQQKTSNLNNLADQASEEAQGKEHKETETREETSKEKVKEHASQELKEQKSQNEGPPGMKKQATKKSKMPPPLEFAGSALLVSILVLVFNFLLAKKR